MNQTEAKPMTSKERQLTDTIQKQNERIQELWDSREKLKTEVTELYNECEHFKSEYRNAHDINAELMQRVEELEHEIATQREVMQELRGDKVRADMFRVLEEYVHDDVDVIDIGKAVVSYHDLLVWGACHGDD